MVQATEVKTPNLKQNFDTVQIPTIVPKELDKLILKVMQTTEL